MLRTLSLHKRLALFYNNPSRSMASSSSSSRRVQVPEPMEVKLTDVEKNICDLLQDCTQFLHEEKDTSTVCRIAGGWVRDKLLGSQSNDMDVALSDMMGLAFAEKLTQFAHTKGIELGTITKIEQNPEQSKHLETATLRIFGLDIDLVNLRSEEYADGSRIPTGVSFGTPLEDALRRDITINALFYNIETRTVEDFTGKGLDDLRNGTIRTPMPPRDTFLDDPLRVLRCIRFASRFGFDVVPEVKKAMKEPIVQEALVSKVARERVGDEVGKMIKGRDPLHSAQLIHELGLYHSIFSVLPPDAKSAIPDTLSTEVRPKDALGSISILYELLASQDSSPIHAHPEMLTLISKDSSSKARLSLAALLVPFMGLSHKEKAKIVPLVTSVLRDSLKLGSQNHFLDGIPTLFAAIPIITDAMEQHSKEALDRVKIGLLLRNKLVHNPMIGAHWTTTLLFSLVIHLLPFYNIQTHDFVVEAASQIVSSHDSFLETILSLGLQNEVDAKPLLNGREICAVFGTTKSGAWVGRALEDVVEWQLGHPSDSKDDCIQWLKNRGPESYIMADQDDKSKLPSKRLRTK